MPIELLHRRERPSPKFTLGRFLTDPQLLGQHFQSETWWSWLALLKAARGEALSTAELSIYQQLTGRDKAPSSPVNEFYAAAGRGSGKSRVNSALAVYLATSFEWPAVLSRGEQGVVMLLASDRTQARILMNYIAAFFEGSSLLSSLVVHRTSGRIELRNQVDIEVHTSSYKSVRGRSLIACLCDELAFWRSDESVNPDTEVIRAVRPGLARVPGSMLMCFSSPYRRSGALWRAYQKYYAKDSDRVLFIKATTRDLNLTIEQRTIDEALVEDPEAARSEWLAEFRSDISSFLSDDELQCARREDEGLQFQQYKSYRAAVDMSGGRKDRFALAVGHQEPDRTIQIDNVWSWRARLSVESVVSEMVEILNSYQLVSVVGDKYGAELTRSIFQAKNIRYRWNQHNTSDTYLEVRVLFSTNRIRIPKNGRLLDELRSLERRPGASGRDKVDHGPGQHDDLAAAMAACAFVNWKGQGIDTSVCETFSHDPLPAEIALEIQAESTEWWEGSLT